MRQHHGTSNLTWSRAALAVASVALPGVDPAPGLGELDPAAWQELVTEMRNERLSGLLITALRTGTIGATPEQRREAVSLHSEFTRLTLALEATLISCVEVLDRAGLPYRVLKGPSLSQLDYPEHSQRCFTDIDLLAAAEHFDQTIGALGGHGYRRSSPEVRTGFDRRFGKAATLVNSDGLAVDVHRTLDRGPFGLLVRLRDLWTAPDRFSIGGIEVLSLPPELRLMNVCFHAVLGDSPPRLSPIRDVAQILLGGRIDTAEVLGLAERWKAEVVVARAVQLAWQALGLPDDAPLVEWSLAYQPHRWERRTLALYLDPSETHLARALRTVRFIPGVREKAGYLRAIAFPDASYLSDRERTRRAHWGLASMPWRRQRAGRAMPRHRPGSRV